MKAFFAGVIILFFMISTAGAHEVWILTPDEVMDWNSRPKPELFSQWSTTNITMLSIALLFAAIWVRLGFTGAREMFPDLQARLASYGDYSSVILRFCLAWALFSNAFALEPRMGNEILQSPTLLAPDLELIFLSPQWAWLREAQILLGIMFLLGFYVRLAAVLLIGATLLGFFLFQELMLTYFTAVLGVGLYLLLQGPGSHFIPLPTAKFLQSLVNKLASVPRQRAQFLLRILAGLNFLYLGIYFKVLQPNLALGIITTYDVPILHWAPEFFVLLMAIVETLAGLFLLLGILMRPMSIFLLAAFVFFASVLEETFTAHMLFYGVMLTFLFNSAGHWRRPEAKDKPGHIVIIGSGFAAVRAAIRLEKLRGHYSNIKVTLISSQSEFVFSPMLSEVTGGSIQPAAVINPLRRILENTQIIEAQVETVDTKLRQIRIKRLSGVEMDIAYSSLILAQESEPDFDHINGLVEHGLPINSIGDALYLRQEIIRKISEAELLPDGEQRKALLSFAVLGNNEPAERMALEICQLLQAALSAYPAISSADVRVTLFENEESQAIEQSSISQRLITSRNKMLKKFSIECKLLDNISGISAHKISLTEGESIACATIINTRQRLPATLIPGSQNQEQVCNSQLQSAGHPDIFLANDHCSSLKGKVSDHFDQNSLGDLSAYNAWAFTQKFNLLDYKPRKRLIHTLYMGRYSISQIGPLIITGGLAWWISRLSFLRLLPGLERNLRMLIDWLLDIPFRNDIAILTPDRTERLSQAFFTQGEAMMREGEHGDTAFIIQSGKVGVYKNDVRLRELGPGDSLGELALINNSLRTASAICETEVSATCLNRSQFMDLMSGFGAFGEAIKKQSEIYNDIKKEE